MRRRVVFVCAGNICRSPLAEHALRRALAARGIGGVAVTSLGLVAEDGDRPVAATLRAASSAGLDLGGHRARRFHPALLREGDLACVMERRQRERVIAAGVLPSADVVLLGSLAPGPDEEIADPEDGDEAVFDACVARVLECVEALAASLASPPRHLGPRAGN